MEVQWQFQFREKAHCSPIQMDFCNVKRKVQRTNHADLEIWLKTACNSMTKNRATICKESTFAVSRVNWIGWHFLKSSWIYACLNSWFLQAWNIVCNCIRTLYIQSFFNQTLEWENSHYIAFASWPHTCTCSDRFFNQSNKIMSLTPTVCTDVKKEVQFDY
jgi:hypothetical protein